MSLTLDKRSVQASAEDPFLLHPGSTAALEKEFIFLLGVSSPMFWQRRELSLETKSTKADPAFPQRGRLRLVQESCGISPCEQCACPSFLPEVLTFAWLPCTWFPLFIHLIAPFTLVVF